MVRQTPISRPKSRRQATNAPTPELAAVAREVSHGRTTIVLTREFDHPRDAIWLMITEPDQLRAWAPYTADRDLSHVGKVTLTMLDDDTSVEGEVSGSVLSAVVLVADRPTLLEHSWATDVLAWNLYPVGSGCRLTLRQTLANSDMASAVAAGWHLCLDVAAQALSGHPVAPIRGSEAMKHGWSDLNRRYAEALGVEPSRIGETTR